MMERRPQAGHIQISLCPLEGSSGKRMKAQATSHKLTEMEFAPKPRLNTTDLHVCTHTLTNGRVSPHPGSVFRMLHCLYLLLVNFLALHCPLIELNTPRLSPLVSG